MDSIIQNFEEPKDKIDYSDPSIGRLTASDKQARFGRKLPAPKLSGFSKNFKIKPLDGYPWYKKNYQADWFKNFKVILDLLILFLGLVLVLHVDVELSITYFSQGLNTRVIGISLSWTFASN